MTLLCPSCGARGRKVSPLTLASLVSESERGCIDSDAAGYCATPSCEVVYFDANAHVVTRAGVHVELFHKSTSPTRPVCYCFGHCVADVVAATREDGSNALVEAITKACRAGLDRCERSNPQGRCCLANVRGVAKLESEPCCGHD